MNVNDITTLVGSLGFPIVMTFLLFRQNVELSETIAKLSNTIAELKQLIEDRLTKGGG